MRRILTVVLGGTFPTMNEYINAERTNRHIAAKIKSEQTTRVHYETLGVIPIAEYPVRIVFNWYCHNQKTDPDNISSAKKFILDGLQKSGVLKKDDWRYVCGFEDNFFLDKDFPRVELVFLVKE